MAKLAATSKSPTHLFPMAMVSWAVMPPPPKLEKALGERRITNYTGVGISICDEVDVSMLQSLVRLVIESMPQYVVARCCGIGSSAQCVTCSGYS